MFAGVLCWLVGTQATTRCSAQEAAQPKPQAKPSAGQAKELKVTEQRRQQLRQALELLGEAELALEAGQRARARDLAERAQKLYPESKAITAFLKALQGGAARQLRRSTFIRAKAHIAAALSRAQVLMQQRRYSESLDLLNGIIEAAAKLPPEVGAGIYAEAAKREIEAYKAGVASGKIRPSLEVVPGQHQLPTEVRNIKPPPFPQFPEAPANAYRLARIAEERVPDWYARIKAALRRKMSVNYRNMPLGLVLDDIKQSTGIKIIIDEPVRIAKTTMTVLVDLRVSAVPAETVLSLATQLAGCEYVILDKGVVVTTKDKAADYLRNLPDVIAGQWAAARYLFPDLYLEAARKRPLPEVKPGQAAAEEAAEVPPYLRSGRELIADIEQLLKR